MREFYVTVAVWVNADDEDDAKAQVSDVLSRSAATGSYDILDVEPADA